MEKRFLSWLGFGFAAVALLAICGVLMHAISLEFTETKKGDLATWTSAIGTIFGFIAVIGVAQWEFSQKRSEHRQAGEVMLQTMLALAYEYQYTLRSVTATFCPVVPGQLYQWFFSGESLFDDIRKGLDDISLHQLPRATDVKLMIVFRRVVWQSAARLESVATTFSMHFSADFEYRRGEEILLEMHKTACWIVENLQETIFTYGAVPMPMPEHLAALGRDWRLDPHTGSIN